MLPRTLFRTVALAEAVTWTLLLISLFLKYGLGSADVTVRIAGGLHGFVFLCYLLATCFTWVNQRWTLRTGVLTVISSVIPYASIPLEKSLERRGLLAGHWRLAAGGDEPHGFLERLQSWVLRNTVPAVIAAIAVVGVIFSLLLQAGPPNTWFS